MAYLSDTSQEKQTLHARYLQINELLSLNKTPSLGHQFLDLAFDLLSKMPENPVLIART